MLSALIGLQIVRVMAAQPTPDYFLTPFVTSRQHQLQQVGAAVSGGGGGIGGYDERDSSVSVEGNVHPTTLHRNFKDNLKLRFHPVGPMPRLFWHKFKLNATSTEEATTTEIISTTTTEDDELETTTTTTTTTTTIAPPPATTPTIILTTPNTVMRPTKGFVPKIWHLFKHVSLFGSPGKLNFLQRHGNPSKAKGKGFLGLFEMIEINNTKCSVNVDNIRTMDGICYHDLECKNLGGIPTKSCAEGAGVCCIFLTSCGETTDQSVVYFESPNYPNPVRETMICALIINLGPNVQQLRLDFIMFELNRPTDGDCMDDQFIVSGQNINQPVPILCGINTGQHMYLHVGNSFDKKVYLSFFAKVPKGGRSFNVKISQLEDDLAPTNCLQYFTETEGVIKSFNYDTLGTIVDNREATYLNNLNYAVCLERFKNACSVTYVVGDGNGDALDFQIINKDEDENDLMPDGQAGAGIFNCPDDYIAINSVRLCGERLNDGTENEDFTAHAPVRDIAAGPIVLPVRTDSEYVGRGFHLLYKQELCV